MANYTPIQKLFRINKGLSWPRIKRGNAISHVQKILEQKHVRGLPANLPRVYYGQRRENLNLGRTFRNRNVSTLDDGVYLYLIEYDEGTHTVHKSFVRVLNLIESGSRHFQLPTLGPKRVIIAAGELSKKGPVIKYNLESGTYMKELMKITETYVTEAHYKQLVQNTLGLKSNNYRTGTLMNNVPAALTNLFNRGNLSFYYGTPTNKTKERVLAQLKAAGYTSNNAAAILRQLAGRKNSSPARASASPPKRKVNNNGNAPRTAQGNRKRGRAA
jgi:hypothetical protein